MAEKKSGFSLIVGRSLLTWKSNDSRQKCLSTSFTPMTATGQCRICGSLSHDKIGTLRSVPVLTNVAYDTVKEAQTAQAGVVSLISCSNCKYVWNSAFVGKLIEFNDTYENDQSNSSVFAQHLVDAARYLFSKLPDGMPIHLLEIGCGQGAFIESMVRCFGERIVSIEAFEPAWQGVLDFEPPTAIYKELFNEETARNIKYRPNLCILRHSIDYLDDPLKYLRLLRTISSETAFVFVETPSIDDIFARRAVEDFCYERQSFFGEKSLSVLLEIAGWQCVGIKRCFANQYIWALGDVSNMTSSEVSDVLFDTNEMITDMFRDVQSAWVSILSSARDRGPVAIWGAGSKGAIFAMMGDPTRRLIECAIDINSKRQGKFLPVSGLQVISPQEAAGRGLQTILVMNSAYLTEVKSLASELKLDALIICPDNQSS